MKVLQLTVHFYPNIGGVETHLFDLVEALEKRGHQIFVLAYRPLSAKVPWRVFEKKKEVSILRIPWLAGFFYKFVKYPIAEFLYLVPGLFLTALFVILLFNPQVVHAHGLVAGFVGVFWGRLFGKKVIVSTHSIYSFPKKGLYRDFAKWIFSHADKSLGLSKQAAKEIESLGIPKQKTDSFTYWIDPNLFKRIGNAKKVLGWDDKFVVLFVGRLVDEKGIIELLESVKKWDKGITLVIAGSGPLEEKVRKTMSKTGNIKFVGSLPQDKLSFYYSASDILIVPSTSEEGFGRVILEALACGTPVIGSNRGAIPEAMDETVGKLIEVSPQNIKNEVEYFFKSPNALKELRVNCRKFAERRYSERNVEKIIKAYTG